MTFPFSKNRPRSSRSAWLGWLVACALFGGSQPATHGQVDPAQVIGDALNAAFQTRADALGVVTGVFEPGGNVTIEALEADRALDIAAELIEAMRQAGGLGGDPTAGAPTDEMVAQLVLRAYQDLDGRLTEAETEREPLAFAAAFEELLRINALKAAPEFPVHPSLASLAATDDLAGLATRLDALLVRSLARGRGDSGIRNLSEEARRLLAIVDAVGNSYAWSPEPYERLVGLLDGNLGDAAAAIAAEDRLPHLVDLVRAGGRMRALADAAGVSLPTPWVSNTLAVIVARLAEVAESQAGWSYLYDASVVMLDDAERLNQAGDQARRRDVLAHVVTIQHAAQAVLDTIWSAEENRRNGLIEDIVDMVLPGDIFLEEARGIVEFNRETGVLAGSFTGRIEIPKWGLSMRVEQGSIDSQGTFALDGYLDPPLAIPGGSVTAALALEGGAGGLGAVTGSGTLTLAADGSTYALSVSYDPVLDRLHFDSSAQDLELRFTDQFVLFEAGLGVTLSTGSPAGQVRVSGSAGFLADGPLPIAGVAPSNFVFYAEQVSTVLDIAPDGFTLSVTNGLLTLPGFIQFADCETGAALSNVAGLSVTPEDPLFVAYSGVPAPEVTFGGGVTISNVLLVVPGFESIQAAVCRANLAFRGGELPILDHIEGYAAFPIPDDTVRVAVVDAAWDLSGFPVGAVTLEEDVTLFDIEGWTLDLLGENSGGCPDIGLRVDEGAGGLPAFRVDAGIRVSAPTDWIAVDGGTPLSGIACGWLAGDASGFSLAMNVLRIPASGTLPETLYLGGTNGLAIHGASVSVEHPESLLDPAATDPFQFALSGSLAVPGGLTFGLEGARVELPAGGTPAFGVDALSLQANHFEPAPGVVIHVQTARLEFVNTGLPVPDYFAPSNVRIRFDGSLDFPGQGVHLAVQNAALNPDGTFHFDADGVVALEGVAIDATVTASNTSGVFTVTGAGDLALTNGPSFAVDIAYDGGTQTLQFDSTTQDLDLRFTDDFVLFDAGFGFAISGTSTQGEFRVLGSAGFLARQALPPAGPLGSEDFYLHLPTAEVVLALSPSGFSLDIEDGELRLPAFFSSTDCVSGSTTSDPPVLRLSTNVPLQITYDVNQPQPLDLSAGLQVQNVAIQVPGLTGMVVQVCSAELTLDGISLPELTNLNGSVQIPLPEQTATVSVVNAAWRLDGFPTGRVRWEDDIPLFDLDGFVLTLLGAGQGGCPESGLLVQDTGGAVPDFRLDGGVRLTLPSEWISETDGAPLSGMACGSIGLESEEFAFSLDVLRIPEQAVGSTLLLGGSNGVVVSAGQVEVLNAGNLLDLSPSSPFSILLDGDFDVGDFGFTFDHARLVFTDYSYPAFTADGLLARVNAFSPVDGVEIQVDGAGIEFVNGGIPAPELFAFDNMNFRFDGSVSFADEAVTLGVTNSVLYANGDFAFNAFTDVPAVFDGVSLTADVGVLWSNGLFQVDGIGSVMLDSGESFTVSAGYDAQEQRLRFDSLASDLDLRFTDDFVVFDAGFGFDLSTSDPSGSLRALGSAGLFAQDVLPPAGLTRTNFYLFVDQAAMAFAFDPDGFALALTNGTLFLPDWFSPQLCEGGVAGGGPAIVLSSATPIQLSYTFDPAAIAFSGALQFENLGLAVPGFTNLAVEVCSTTLSFDGTGLPLLSNVTGRLSVPLPDQAATVDVVNVNWSLDGFPEGQILLTSDLTVFDQGGFSFTVLGADPETCPLGTGITISNSTGFLPELRLDGGIKLAIDEDILTVDGGSGAVTGSACGSVTLDPTGPPRFELISLTVSNRFRLGGADGMLIDGSVSAQNVGNLFQQSVATPFIIALSGDLEIQGDLGIGLNNARFIFEGNPLPRFELGGGTVSGTLALSDGLSVSLASAGFDFKAPGLAFPDLLSPTNIVLLAEGASAQIGVGDLGISGQVVGLEATIEPDGSFRFLLDGIGMGIEGLDFGVLSLSGNVFIAGLSNPDNWFFAGEVGGVMSGTRVSALLAFNKCGPIGVCVGLTSGSGGIPLGQTTLMLSGIEGGVAFLDRTGDPCDFASFISFDTNGVPSGSITPICDVGGGSAAAAAAPAGAPPEVPILMTWEELDTYNALARQEQALYASGVRNLADVLPTPGPAEEEALQVAMAMGMAMAGPSIPCPTNDCPPPTVGILCQPHPDVDLYPDRIIFKFSAVDEDLLNQFGVTESALGGVPADAGEIATFVVTNVRSLIESFLPSPDPDLLGTNYNAFLDFYESGLMEMELVLFDAMYGVAAAALGSPTTTVYQAIVDAAYAGVPCPKLTVKLQGTLTQTAVSSFLSADVGVVLSTDITGNFIDSAGIVGGINLVGIPVGNAEGYVLLTDESGQVNPSVCGEAEMAIGPVEFGEAKFSFRCPDCNTGVLEALADLFLCVGDEVVLQILANIAPDVMTNGYTEVTELVAFMDENQKAAFFAELASLPSPPPGIATCFLDALGASWDSIQPELLFCGEVGPKLFGIPLAGNNLFEMAGQATKTNLVSNFSFSPSYVLITAIGMNYFPPLALDQASMGIGFTFPDAGEFLLGGLSGQFATPEALSAYLIDSFDDFMQDAVITGGYEINPFGLKMADGEARVIMPNFIDHPVLNPGWSPPAFPTRQQVLFAALENNLLANPLWKGTPADLAVAFDTNSAAYAAVSANGYGLAEDYFRHGGLAGAIRMTLPPALTDAPSEEFFTLLDPGTDLVSRVTAGLTFLQRDVLAFTNEVGTLSFYVPAPNPPLLTNAMGELVSTRDIVEAMYAFDPSNFQLGEFYPGEQAFVEGSFDAQFLGVPLGSGTVLGVPLSATNSEAFFRVTGDVPTGSWMSDFIGSASLEFELRQTPAAPIDVYFSNVVADLQSSLSGSDADRTAAVSNAVAGLADQMPKASLEATMDSFQIPPYLADLVAAPSGSASLFAYSPRFEPTYVGTGPVAVVRREGGIAFRTRLRFGDYLDVNNAELAVQPNPLVPELSRLIGAFDIASMTLPGGVSMTDVTLQFDNLPPAGQPFLVTSGAITPFSLGALGIQVLPAQGGTLTGNLSMINQGGGPPAITFLVDPVIVDFDGAGVFTADVLVHGSSVTNPFSFSTVDPWSADITVDGDFNLKDPISGDTLVSLGTLTDYRASIVATGLTDATLVIELPPGIQATVFPDTFNQTLDLAVPGVSEPIVLTVGSDGSWAIDAKLEQALGVSGSTVAGIAADADVHIDPSGMTVHGILDGGLLSNLGDGGAVTAAGVLEVSPLGVVSVTGTAQVSTLSFGLFEIAPTSGPTLEVVVGDAGLDVNGGPELRLTGITDAAMTLDELFFHPDGSFQVDVTLGRFSIGDYFALDGAGGTFALNRTAAGVVSLTLGTPTVVLFDGEDFETQVPGFGPITIDSRGEFLNTFNNTDISFALPGGFTVDGKLEIGYEFDDTQPLFRKNVAHHDFGEVAEGDDASQEVVITNDGGGPLTVTAVSSDPQVFPVSPYSLSVPGGGGTRTLHLGFAPPGPGSFAATVTLTHNAAGSPDEITVVGDGPMVPVYHQSRDALDFGTVAIEGQTLRSFKIRNLGSGNLVVNSIQPSNPAYQVLTGSSFTLIPGQESTVSLRFSPTSLGDQSATLTVTTATLGASTVDLSGAGTVVRWYVQREEFGTISDFLRAMDMSPAGRGTAVGDDGRMFTTENRGAGWTRRPFPYLRVYDLLMDPLLRETHLALYFEEPDGFGTYLDRSLYQHHAAAPAASFPPNDFDFGRFGRGVRFDGVNDYLEVENFNLANDWTISMWVNPHVTGNGRAFVGINPVGPANLSHLVIGHYGGGVHVNLRNQTMTVSSQRTGWQHLAVVGTEIGSGGDTRVTVFRNGISIGSAVLGAVLGDVRSDHPWSLGQEWDGFSRSDFFDGDMDQVLFFAHDLSTAEVNRLAAYPPRQVMVGEEGYVFQTRDEGETWQLVTDTNLFNESRDWHAVARNEDGNLVLVGEEGNNPVAAVETNDGAFVLATFGAPSNVGGINDLAFDLAVDDWALSVGDGGRIYQSGNGGAGWGSIISGVSEDLNAIAAIPPFNYVAVGDNGTILRSDALGNTWSPIHQGDFNGVDFLDVVADGTTVYAVGQDGTYVISTDGGQSWTQEAAGTFGDLSAVDVDPDGADTDVFAAGAGFRIFHRPADPPSGPIASFSTGTLDFGHLQVGEIRERTLTISNPGAETLTITSIAEGGAPFELAQTRPFSIEPGERQELSVVYRPDAFSVRDLGFIRFTSTDPSSPHEVSLQGRSVLNNWTFSDVGNQRPGVDVWFADANTGYVASDKEIYKSVDGGATWTPMNAPVGARLIRAFGFSDADTGWAVGTSGMILRMTNGSTWQEQTAGVTAQIVDISVYDEDLALIATKGLDGQVLGTDSGGATWVPLPDPVPFFQGGSVEIVGTPPLNVLFLASYGDEVYHYLPFLGGWALGADLGQTVLDIVSLDLHTTWIGGSNGSLWHYDYPDVTPAYDVAGLGSSAIRDLSFYDADHGWAILGGSAYQTSDGGERWEPALTFNGSIFAVHALDADHVWVVGGDAGRSTVVYKYQSAGAADIGALLVDDAMSWEGVPLETDASQTLTLRNLGGQPVAVNDFGLDDQPVGMPFTVDAALPLTVPAGGTRDVTVTFAADAPEPLPDGLELWVRFEEPRAQEPVADYSSHNRTIDVFGSPSAYAGGAHGRAWHFGGSQAHCSVAPFDLGENCSFAFWADPTFTGVHQAVIWKGRFSDDLLIGFYGGSYLVTVENDTHVEGAVLDGLHHYAVVLEGATATFYLDGEALWTHTFAAPLGDTGSSYPWLIGAERDSLNINDYFGGVLDEVMILNRALDADEVARLASIPRDPPPFTADLEIHSDGQPQLHTVALLAEVAPPEHIVVFDTEPSGLPLLVDGTERIAPYAVTIVTDTTNSGQWALGSYHTVEAPLSNAADSVSFAFAGWGNGRARASIFRASTSLEDATATYAPVDYAPPAGGGGRRSRGSSGAGRPTGPYIRVSDASLSHDVLNFSVSGELYLSAAAFNGSLSAEALQFPPGPAPLVRIEPADWEIDFVRGDHFTLVSDVPGISVLGVGATPTATLTFDMQDRTGVTPDFLVHFSTDADLMLIEDVMEISALDATLGYDGGLTLDLDGGFRLLRKPDGTWAFNQSLSGIQFTDSPGFDDNVIASPPDPILDLGYVSLSPGTLSLRRNSNGSMRIDLVGTEVELFGETLLTGTSGSVSSDGVLDIQTTMPSGNFDLGDSAVRVARASGSGQAHFTWDTSQPGHPFVNVTLPAVNLTSSRSEMSGVSLSIPSFTFKTNGDFDTDKLPLPSFDFDGIDIDSGGPLNKNYIRLQREDGLTTFLIRDRRNFFAGRTKMVLRVKSNNSVTGTFSGDVEFEGFGGTYEIASVSLLYDGGETDYQFEGTAKDKTFNQSFTVRFGADGGEICKGSVCISD